MGMLGDSADQLKGRLLDLVRPIQKRIFGANNERLDFVMDSFYKLSPEQRNGAIAGIGAGVVVFVLGVVWLYFAQVGALKQELNDTFAALHEFEVLEKQSAQVEAEFDSLVKVISKKTRSLKIKPFFEKLARKQKVKIEGLSEQRVKLPADSPLANKLEQVSVEMRVPKVSVPRLLKFLVEIEKAGRFLRVQDLQIQGRYGTKLFFDGTVKVRGYLAK